MRLLLSVLSLAIFINCDGQQTKPKTATSTVITPKGATITSLKVGDYFSFPIVTLQDKTKSERINSYLINAVLGEEYNGNNLKTKLEERKKEMDKGSYNGLTSLSFEVPFNNASVVSVSISSCYVGNAEYCDGIQYNFDLNSGYTFGFDQIIIPSKKNELKEIIVKGIAKEVTKRLQQSKSEMKSDGVWYADYEDLIRIDIAEVSSKFEPSLFKLSDKGINFIYSCEPFALIYRNYYPSSEYFYSWNVLKPYLMPSSPISNLVK